MPRLSMHPVRKTELWNALPPAERRSGFFAPAAPMAFSGTRAQTGFSVFPPAAPEGLARVARLFPDERFFSGAKRAQERIPARLRKLVRMLRYEWQPAQALWRGRQPAFSFALALPLLALALVRLRKPALSFARLRRKFSARASQEVFSQLTCLSLSLYCKLVLLPPPARQFPFEVERI